MKSQNKPGLSPVSSLFNKDLINGIAQRRQLLERNIQRFDPDNETVNSKSTCTVRKSRIIANSTI